MLEVVPRLDSLIATLPLKADGTEVSVEKAVSDGDTIHVRADGEAFSVRMLGVDTPETKLFLPESRGQQHRPFHSTGGQKWIDYLTRPLAAEQGPFLRADRSEGTAREVLGLGLQASLAQRVGPGCAANHRFHAERAHRGLEGLVEVDYDERQAQGTPFRFFLAFSFEAVDRYGRRLAFIHREDTPEEQERRTSYNAGILRQGLALPYFIWPNIEPFRSQDTLEEAVPRPGELGLWLADAPKLEEARRAVRQARSRGQGVFEAVPGVGKLRLLPFELRFLADRRAPDRFVLDLSEGNRATQLYPPTLYYRIRRPENRLFINREHLPLFEARGWTVRQ